MSRSTLSSLSLGSGGTLASPAPPSRAPSPPPLTPTRSFVRITIPETTKIVDPHGKHHVVFTVQIRAPGLHRQVLKKFSEFRTFDTVWRSMYPSESITLPPRVWLQSNKSDKVIAERQARLETYLNSLAATGLVVPYLARFLGVSAEILRPRRAPGAATDYATEPIITHYRRRSTATAFSTAAFSTIGSAISLTPSERESATSSERSAAAPPPTIDERRAIARTESYSNSVSESTRTTSTMPPPPPPPPTKAVAHHTLDFQGVLLMALEAVLAPGGAVLSAAAGDFMSLADESDMDGVLGRDWDAADYEAGWGADLLMFAEAPPTQGRLLL